MNQRRQNRASTKVGIGHFHCAPCGRTFVGRARADVRANTLDSLTFEQVRSKCHSCGQLYLPHKIEAPRPIKKKTGNSHHCELCDGQGSCPLMQMRTMRI